MTKHITALRATIKLLQIEGQLRVETRTLAGLGDGLGKIMHSKKCLKMNNN